MLQRPRYILPIIVLSQFGGTSLWFSGNAVLIDLQTQWHIPRASLGHVTSSVQLGFIIGTLAFAYIAIADRFSPRRVFLICSLVGALANIALATVDGSLGMLLLLRFCTGFFLAGIYPVGMKIAAGWYRGGLGNALGFLVGALVLGTAFPHLLKGIGAAAPWQTIVLSTSVAAALGGFLMFALVPDGPYLSSGSRFDPVALVRIFRIPTFRASSFGYFGHMWELYAFWTFLPHMLDWHASQGGSTAVSLWTFAIIAAGSFGCVAGGLLSLRLGSAPVAFVQLSASGLCCLLSPLAFHSPAPLLFAFLIFWGIVVVGDSPQFSALNANHAPKDLVGTALTIANCLGFAITIGSIQLLSAVFMDIQPAWLFVFLAPGPILGLIALRPMVGRQVWRRI